MKTVISKMIFWAGNGYVTGVKMKCLAALSFFLIICPHVAASPSNLLFQASYLINLILEDLAMF